MNLRDLVDPAELDRILAEHPDSDIATDMLLGMIMRREPEKFAEWLNHLQQVNPEQGNLIAQKLSMPGVILEMMGYEPWLKKMGPKTFTRPFAPVQHEFWQWNWNALQKLRRGIKLSPWEKVAFVPWSRETGKSSHVEWACIAEGALLAGGYVVYVGGKHGLAEEHVSTVRNRIEEAHVGEVYPRLSKPKLGAHGNKYGWGKDFLLTHQGWAIRPVGLEAGVRGGKTGDLRPTLIILDDLDDINDSLAVVLSKENILTHSILPMGNSDTRILVAQNPIHETSLVNRLLTGACSALAVRKIFGPVKAMENFESTHVINDDGPRDIITQGTSNWPGITEENWQETLDRVGLPSFLAEYQHDFSGEQEERVLPEYDDRVHRLHVITWSQFVAKYYPDTENPPRRIPNYWPKALGGDIGYTPAHASAFSWITRVPENAPLTGTVFRYRGRIYIGMSPDDIALAVKDAMWPGEFETINHQLLSHEKLGERLLFNQKHGYALQPCEKGKESGVPQWRHYLTCDKSRPHPFHPDKLESDGKWKLGCPSWFDVVADGQEHAARDDYGLKVHRNEAYNWKYKKVKVTESGLTVEQPMKIDDNSADSTRMCISRFGPVVLPKTHEERILDAIPENYRWENLQKRTDLSDMQKEMSFRYVRERAEKAVGGKTFMPPVDDFGQPLDDSY